MATVYQEDYDSFYESIYWLVEYEKLSRIQTNCACEPRRMTPEEKKEYELKRTIELMMQPQDEAISLSGKEYGDFIDKNYKATFIELKRSRNQRGIDTLIDKIANEIKRKKETDKEIDTILNTMFVKNNNDRNSSTANNTNKDWAEICNLVNEMSSKDSWVYKPTKKKSLWDRIKDFLNKNTKYTK